MGRDGATGGWVLWGLMRDCGGWNAKRQQEGQEKRSGWRDMRCYSAQSFSKGSTSLTQGAALLVVYSDPASVSRETIHRTLFPLAWSDAQLGDRYIEASPQTPFIHSPGTQTQPHRSS